jgi:pimeloyl-ACP methyl ester carboxylesterase
MIHRLPLALLAAAAALTASCSQQTASQTASGALPRFERGPCAADMSAVPRPVECGTLVVAETRMPGGGAGARTVSIPVVIVKATAANPKPDPVIFLHGGPGGSVVETVPFLFDDSRVERPAGSPPLPAYVTGDRDWIFFDQRGGGLGQPKLDCGEVQLTDSGLVSDADVALTDACHTRLSAAGIDLTQFNAQAIAGDVADLRTALGFDQFNVFGVSYGSRIVFAIQRYAPEGLRAAIHDAPYPPEAKGTEELPALVAREVREVLAKCEASDACRTRYGGLEPRLTAAAAAWAATPRVVGGKTYRVEDLASYLLDATYSWAGTRALPRNLTAILDGDMTALDTYMADRSSYDEGQNLTHFCKEELPFESEAAMRAKAGTDPLALAIVTTAARYFQACRAWAVGPPNPSEIEPVTSDVPTLMTAAQIDAGCPVDYVNGAVRTLSRGTVVEVPNATHGISRRSACVRGMIHRFLDDPSKPVDTGCIAGEHTSIPFTLN